MIRVPNLRWGGDKKRPGVEAIAVHKNVAAEEAPRYRVVTRQCRTEHETFEEASTEFRLRRAGRTA